MKATLSSDERPERSEEPAVSCGHSLTARGVQGSKRFAFCPAKPDRPSPPTLSSPPQAWGGTQPTPDIGGAYGRYFKTKATISRRTLLLGSAFIGSIAGPALAAPAEVKIRDLWAARGEFSDLAKGLDGRRIAVRGYMAPPLKPEIDFFVLTKIPMAFCPFCDNAASWPEDLMLVKVAGATNVVEFNRLITTEGLLELGTKTDEATGFVSRIRLLSASYSLA